MQFKKILCAVLSAGMLAVLSGCSAAVEQEKTDVDSKDMAIEIAEKYFDKSFEYDFDFYGGGGEGDAAMDIYVFTDGSIFNCVSIPVRENAPDPRVYYNCYLHQFQSGRWQLQEWENNEKAVLDN